MEIFENFFEKFFYFFQKKFGFFEKKCYICIIKNEKKKGTHNETQEQIFKSYKRNDSRRAKENPPMPQRGGIHRIKKSGAKSKAD